LHESTAQKDSPADVQQQQQHESLLKDMLFPFILEDVGILSAITYQVNG